MSRTGGRLALLLWPVALVYLTWLGLRAHDELTDTYVVDGLFRTYRPPRPVPEGWLIDARPAPLLAELDARFRLSPSAQSTPLPADIEGWRRFFTKRGAQVSDAHGPGDGIALLVTPTGPWLQTGRFRGEASVVDPRRGVILLDEASLKEAPALRLDGLEARDL